jgi:hypothetical protein
MARLYLFVEGQTERTFADTVLKPHLANLGVYLHFPVLIAHARKKGRVHRGGGRNYVPMKSDILRLLAQEKGGDVFFTTMIDLYAIHANFPGLAEAEKLRHMPAKRVEALEQAFAKDICDGRFVPYIQLHEFEALILAAPQHLDWEYLEHDMAIANLVALSDPKNPEEINDRPEWAPSKRIIAEIPEYEKQKAVVGHDRAKGPAGQQLRSNEALEVVLVDQRRHVKQEVIGSRQAAQLCGIAEYSRILIQHPAAADMWIEVALGKQGR